MVAPTKSQMMLITIQAVNPATVQTRGITAMAGTKTTSRPNRTRLAHLAWV